MDRKDIAFEIKEVTAQGAFAGYGSVYGVIDSYDDIIQAGAFSESLTECAAKGVMPAMLWQHRSGEPCGAYQSMKEDGTGLYVEGSLAMKTQRGAEAYELMKMKAISGLSVGFMTREDSYDKKTNIRTIKKGDLWECSLVTFPANDSARISSVKSIEEITDLKGMERYLRESGGFSRNEATALVARIKKFAQGEPGADDEASQLIAALSRRTCLLKA